VDVTSKSIKELLDIGSSIITEVDTYSELGDLGAFVTNGIVGKDYYSMKNPNSFGAYSVSYNCITALKV